MDELETRLRDGLTALAEPVRPAVEAKALFAPGEQRRARRRLTALAGGAASVLAIGLALGAMPGLRGIPPVAVVATPSPVASSSASASTKPALVLPGTTDQVVIDSGGLVNELMATQVQMNATLLDDGRYSVQAVLQRGDRLDYEHAAINDGHSITWFQLTSKVVVGFVPHRLNWIQYSDKDGVAYSHFTSDFATFTRFDATVVYRIAYTAGDYPGLRGYLWRGLDGGYYDGDGTLLPSDTYNGVTLYLSERLGIVGMLQDGTFRSIEDRGDRATFLDSWVSPKTTKAAVAVLLPAGASKPEVHAGVNGTRVDIEALGGRVLVIATANVPDSTVPLITSITYTDAGGKKATDKG